VRRLANLHDDRGFDVSVAVERGEATPAEAFDAHYRWRMQDLALQFYTVGGDSVVFSGDADRLAGALRRLDHLRRALDHDDEFVVVEHSEDLDLVEAGTRRGLVLTIEGGAALGSADTSVLRTLYRLGLRSVNLLWFRANALGDGLAESRGAGLTDFGREVVREMNRLGMLPDVTQSSRAACADVLAEATVPVIASHSNAAGQHDHPRNLTDDELRAIAATGGLVGLNGFPAVVGGDDPGIDDLLAHVRYIAELVGPEHVCLGLNIIPTAVDEGTGRRDAVGVSASHASGGRASRHLPDVPDVTAAPAIIARMAELGFDEATIDLVAFGNVARVLRSVLRPAGEPPPDAAEVEGGPDIRHPSSGR
jgi:membrane dipeptidase